MILPAYASRAPDAGSLGNQLRYQQPLQTTILSETSLTLPVQKSASPDNRRDSLVSVVIRQVQFQGLEGTTVSEAQAQQVIADFLNKPLNFKGLRRMADAISRLCRSHDMPLAQTILPPQSIKDGILNIRVIPGHYDRTVITGQAKLRDSVIARIARTKTPAGNLILRSRLEHTALLLNSIPGISSHLTLRPGSVSGSSLLDIETRSTHRYSGYLSIDNLGDPATGRGRVFAIGQINGLPGPGDQLQINLLNSYEKRRLLTGILNYSLLAGGYATRIGLNYGHLRYHYYLQGLKFNGYSNNWSLYIAQPWIYQSRARVDTRFDVSQQFLHDNFPAAISRGSQRKMTTGTVSFTGTVSSMSGGLTEFNLRGITGQVGAGALAGSSIGSGRFSRFNYQLSHLQYVWGPLSVFAGIKGQLASSNMDSSQKFLLGGNDAVRAYDTASGAVDDGYIMTIELRNRWNLPFNLLNTRPELNISAFYDQGSGFQFKNNLNLKTGMPFIRQGNRVMLTGVGLYLSLMVRANYSLTVTWARRIGKADPMSGDRGRERVWLTAIKAF